MNISVFGLGYVGAVCCAVFVKNGNTVIGVDVNSTKVDLINKGQSSIVEKGLDDLILKAVEKNRLRATIDPLDATLNSDISILCVGTPSQLSGKIDLTYVYNVVQQIAKSLIEKDTFHTIVIRSTVAPGTLDICAQIVEDVSGKKLNTDFGLVSNPEFLREGTALYDFDNPPYTIIEAGIPMKPGLLFDGNRIRQEAPIIV